MGKRSGRDKPASSGLDRRTSLAALAALCGVTAFGAAAQAQLGSRRIAYLSSVTIEADIVRFDAFKNALKGLGYVEGQNLSIESRHEAADAARLADLAAELLQLKPSVFVTVATPATVAAKNVTREIPIVFSGVGDPVAFGLVTSLQRPGANITGLANVAAELAGKRLELLKELLPKLELVGVLLEPQTPVSVLQWGVSVEAARRLGLRLHPMRITSPDVYEAAFAEAAAAGVTAVAASLSPSAGTYSARIVRLAAEYRLPSIYARLPSVYGGGLMSYAQSFESEGRVMARLVQRIFAGALPADLPVEQPTEFELLINMKTARQLGLTIPKSLLLRTSRFVE